MKRSILLVTLLTAVLDNGFGADPLRQGAVIDAEAPPWLGAPMDSHAAPRVYLREWKRAENRERCAPLVLMGAEAEPGLKIRRANFLGGWAVAYDTPQVRSSFGIAGTGLDLDSPGQTFRFPHVIRWSDGSAANYGPEGGIGPNYLAYLSVVGQKCLYNLWSARGKAHLEQLISTLRRIEAKDGSGP